MKQNLKKLGAVVLGTSALMGVSQQAFAKINIQSVSTYSTVINEDKFKNLGDFQAENEERFAVLYDVVKNFANGTYSATDVANNLPALDVMQDGDTLSVFSTKGSVVGATIDTEPIVRIGSGSNIKVDAQGFLDVENSENVTIAGKTYNFAGGETSGIVSIGDLAGRSGGATRKLSGVSAATLSDTSLEAVNGSQLYATNKAIDGLKTDIDNLKGDFTNLGGTFGLTDGTTTINKPLNSAITVRPSDSNIKVFVSPDGAANGGLNIGLSPNVTADSFKAGDVLVSMNGINAGNLKVDGVADGLIAEGSKQAINGGQLHDALKDFDVGNVVKYDGNTQDTVTLQGGTTGTAIKNVKAGDLSSTSKDAVNGSQLYATNQNVANNTRNLTNLTNKVNQGWTANAETGTPNNIQMGETLKFIGDTKNIGTSVEADGSIKISLKPNVSADSFTAGDIVIDKTTGINAGNKKITNLAKGDISATSTDAVNGSQLYDLANTFNQELGNVVKYDGNGKDTVTLQGGTTGTAIKNVKAGDLSATSKDAVNGSQLYATNQNVANNTRNLTNLTNKVNGGLSFTDGTTTINKQLGDVLEISAGDSNVDLAIKDGKYKVALNKNLTGDSFTAGGVTINKTTGINAGDLNINGVADGLVAEGSKQAVNGGQLYQTNKQLNDLANHVGKGWNAETDKGTLNVQLDSTIGMKGDGNIGTEVVEFDTGNVDDYGNPIKAQGVKINLNKDLNLNSVKMGGVSISTGGINVGGQKVENMADGDVSINSTDGINGSQLFKAQQNLTNMIEDNRKLASQGIAAAAATDIEYVEQSPGSWVGGIGLGHYDKQTAVGIGTIFTSENGRYKLNLAYGQAIQKKSKPLFKTSVSFQFN